LDTLTHALAGALIGRATAPREGQRHELPLGRRVFAGALAAAFPDIDVVASYLSPLAYLYHHRGVTHSFVLLPLWTLLLAVILAAVWRGKPGWRAYIGVCAAGIASHIVLDLITAFGTMIFSPFSDARYALSATFIIDLWFSGIVVAGLILCGAWRRSRAPALAALAVLASYVGAQFLLQQRAVEFGRDYARMQSIDAGRVTALPRPVSPFNWTVIVENGERYRYAHVNLVRTAALPEPGLDSGFVGRLDAPYRPLSDAAWIESSRYGDSALARDAYSQPGFRFFRWFAAYPAFLHVDAVDAARCAWFHDLRFVTPGRSGTPFQYGMCRDGAGRWQAFQKVAGERRPVY
jgi:inner membrane protein